MRPELNYGDNTLKRDNYVIEIALEPEQEEKFIEDEEKLKDEEKAEEDFPEKKRKLFVDTADKSIDEEPQIETNKVGEKGSTAKDMYTGEDNVNDAPRLESKSDMLAEAPEELPSAVPKESGFPIEISPGDYIKDTSQEINMSLVEEITNSSSDVNEREILQVNNEAEGLNELQDVSVQKDTRLDTIKDAGPRIEDINETASTSRDSDIVIMETISSVNMQTETDVIEERTDKKTEHVKEYKETASISKEMMKEIIEGRKENVSNKIQRDLVTAESQINKIPTGDNVPFFEDNISNAPIRGQESFNVKKHEYAPYYKHIRDKISWYWLLQYGTDASINLVTKEYKPVIVEFKVLPSGRITDVVVVNSAGNELLSSKVQKSVQNTILNKFPEYVNEKYINVRFNFYFF